MRCLVNAICIFIVVLPAQPVAVAAASLSTRPLPPDGVITESGNYQLGHDLVVERDIGVTIKADDVVLDLAGYALRFRADPRKGTFGVVANGCSNIRITNGTIGGFWFNMHCTESRGLRIDKVRFDDIVYIAAHVAGSRNVLICDSTFTNFRYDASKPDKDRYNIGINIGAEDAVIAHNRFDAEYTGSDPRHPGGETVFVLFSADVSRRCVVTHNRMAAKTFLDRSYRIWVASNAQVTATHNSIHNMKYGVCVATGATTLAGFNRLSVDSSSADASVREAFGIHAAAASKIVATENEFDGLIHTTVMPESIPAKE